MDIARKNKLLVHGHTLVFGEANPTWVKELRGSTPADKDRVERVMIDHIRQTVSHFKGKIASWDVINEPLADYDTPAGVGGLRKHIWYEAMGEKYIASALAAARQADPQAKLYINEFGLEGDGDRWATFLALVKKLKSQNVPIDGVGFQAHVYDADDEIDPVVLRSHIRELAELGLVSRISEMDVHSEGGIAAQAKQYAAVFDVCFSEPSCVSWSTWGVTDRYNLWQDENGRLQQGRDFLWDEQYQPTAGLSAIREMIVR
ncbi:Endo-1,4-beta-xylanase Z precursor [compost metagenome]